LTPVLFNHVDIGDEMEIERVVRQAVRPILSTPVFAEDRLPAGQRSWFDGFIRRCAEAALLDSHPHVRPADLDRLWHSFTRDLIADGIVSTVLSTLRLANDGDGKEERRGWAWHARDVLKVFLRDSLDLHHVTVHAVTARDPDEWKRYPAWFGPVHARHGDAIAFQRAIATRWMPLIGGESAILRMLLSDSVPEVRFIAAVRLAKLYPDATDSEIVHQLQEAAADETWTWSSREYYATLRTGADEAGEILAAIEARATSRRDGAA
jgi:hypothetical protein